MKYVMDLKKAQPVETNDGLLTNLGMQIAHKYAVSWVKGVRNLELERRYPQLVGLFYDIRVDSELARTHAVPVG